MTREKVRERLGKIQVQRVTLRSRLTATEELIRQESNTLLGCLDLLEKPGAFYAAADYDVNRRLIVAYFSAIYMDDDGHKVMIDTQPQDLVARIRGSAGRIDAKRRSTGQLLGASDSSVEPSVSHGIYLSKSNVVHPAGFEPATYCSGNRRSIP